MYTKGRLQWLLDQEAKIAAKKELLIGIDPRSYLGCEILKQSREIIDLRHEVNDLKEEIRSLNKKATELISRHLNEKVIQ